MAAILADDILKCIFLNENYRIPIQFHRTLFLVDNKWALPRVMAWCQTGDKPLPKPMLAKCIDANMC